MNIQFISALLLAGMLGLTGCVTPPKPTNGTITSYDISAASPKIAKDSVNFLSQQFSPANTRFNLTQAVLPTDTFSKTFIDELRQRGFEIQENATKSSYNNMTFTLDNNDNMSFIRILINIDNSTYSRCYSGSGSAMSSWSVIKK
jgi:hypothetical protein